MSLLKRRQALRFTLAAFAVPAMVAAAMADGHVATHTVTIKGFKFEPANLTINAGDKVVFVNADAAPHTATANNKSFGTGRLKKGQQAALVFKSAGKFAYFCEVHPKMKASITVK
ncbi:plastocyanin [Litoreibacter meonggei]|uniref:Plastocyanin n=1 Tax=Litoreibacter meonggei TaxID=1049199 RepID=A0A497VCM6_9RHOB|nr:cupredoxin family copper-binding protein [Litoreibacter meonggei]RLJ41032.1 plastocyanin [Litoreibacter meonggei]